MLVRTYKKMMEIFEKNLGYASFAELKKYGVTSLQIHELENEGIVEKFARGWYWCGESGVEKPKDYKYVEIAKAYPKAIVCMESACYLNGFTDKEPEVPTVATGRSDRGKVDTVYPVKRFYLQNAGIKGEIVKVHTKFGDYQYYSPERTMCDCIRMKDKVDQEIYFDVLEKYDKNYKGKDVIYEYAKRLRALQNILQEEEKLNK